MGPGWQEHRWGQGRGARVGAGARIGAKVSGRSRIRVCVRSISGAGGRDKGGGRGKGQRGACRLMGVAHLCVPDLNQSIFGTCDVTISAAREGHMPTQAGKDQGGGIMGNKNKGKKGVGVEGHHGSVTPAI